MNTVIAVPRFIFAALVAVTFIAPMAVHMFIPALPVVKQSLAISNELAFATIALVMMTMAFATLIYGGFSDHWGRKQVLLTGLALFTIGSELSWIAPDIWTLLAGRILQATGAGCGVVLARAIAHDVYGMERIAPVIANLTAAYVLGPALAPTLGAFMIAALGWRSLFMFSAMIGLALIILVIFYLPETRTKPPSKAPVGRIIRDIGRSYGQLLRVPRFTAYMLLPGLVSGTFFANATASAFLARETLGVSTETYGIWFLLLPAGFMAGNFMSGRIGNRASITFMTVTGSILNVGVVLAMWGNLSMAGLSMLAIMLPGFMLGIAQGMCLPYAQAGAMQVNPSLAGSASGAVVFSQLFFAGLAQLLMGFVADGSWQPVITIMLAFSIAAMIAAIVAARSR
jgi:DHA1 family bicyclomycin/chloramphenicol resistance-like MFS transporter